MTLPTASYKIWDHRYEIKTSHKALD